MAKAAPDKDFIGVEVHMPGVGRLLHQIEEHQLSNLRVYHEDVITVLNQAIAPASLSRVQIFFPDPWHKKKHHKRRLIQSEFIQLLRGKLCVGGIIHLATDWQHYADHMLDVMSVADGFTNHNDAGGFSVAPEERPLTKFENRGLRLGHGVWDLLFVKQS